MSQTLKQSSVQQCTFNRVWCPGQLKVPCPWHYRWLLHSIRVHCHCHPSIFGVLTSGTGTAGFLMSSGQISLSKDQFLQVSSVIIYMLLMIMMMMTSLCCIFQTLFFNLILYNSYSWRVYLSSGCTVVLVLSLRRCVMVCNDCVWTRAVFIVWNLLEDTA